MRLSVLLIVAVSMTAAGCGKSGPPAGGGALAIDEIPRVWVDRDVPRALDLVGYVSGDGHEQAVVEVASTADVGATASGLVVTLEPASGFTGDVELAVTVSRSGQSVNGVIPVRVKDGTRRCVTTFRWSGSADTVAVAGDWNAFSTTADPLVETNPGEWETELELSEGEHGYKLVIDGGASWILDPENPLTMWIDGTENSRVQVLDCSEPRLDLFDMVATATGFSANVTFVSANDGAAAASPPSVTLDGITWSGTFDAETRVLALSESSLDPGKHVLVVTASDESGRDAEPLRIPFWVEAAPFDWRDAVAYFVLTDRFRNGSAANDAPEASVLAPANYQGGDWAGVLEAIEDGYFEDLGVTVLWLSPHVDNPGGGWNGADGRAYAGYHGYWPSSPRETEEHFGTADELRAVVDAAHDRGMRVLLDLVVNHVHEESPYWLDHMGAPWFHAEYVCGFEQPINCWFADYLPDFDFTSSDVRDAQMADARFWVEATGADGFRVDALKHFEHVVGRTLRVEVAEREARGGSRFYMVGETFVGRWADGGQNQLAEYISPEELDGQFDFPLYWEILRTVGRGEGTLYDLESMLRGSQGFYSPSSVMGTFVGNHDVPRFISHANGDIADLYGGGSKEQGWNTPPAQPTSSVAYEKLKTAFTILFALPGMPTIYYGDEIGLAGAGDPDNRRFMQWNGVTAQQEAVRTHVSELAEVRRATPGLARGTLQQVWIENDLLVLERRWSDGEGAHRAYLAINRGAGARSVQPQVGASNGTEFADAVNGAEATVTGGSLAIEVPAHGSALYLETP